MKVSNFFPLNKVKKFLLKQEQKERKIVQKEKYPALHYNLSLVDKIPIAIFHLVRYREGTASFQFIYNKMRSLTNRILTILSNSSIGK